MRFHSFFWIAPVGLLITPLSNGSSLGALIEEAEKNNPQIAAARHAWRAAAEMPSQASTLPDPEFSIQHVSVGSPRPFAGYTNSDFAYIGFGVSQDLPYPGKLRLRREAAERDAAAEGERLESTRRSVLQELKAAYFQLAYEHQELALLDRDAKLLDQVAAIADAHYRLGQGNQQDVLKAQLERTKLLRDTEMHHQEHASLQAKLRQILGRIGDRPDIVPDALTETPLSISIDELLATVRTQNPDVRATQEMVQSKNLQLELAHKDLYPDFSLQYMWQHTSGDFRDYYMAAVGVRIPIHQHSKQWPEILQAAEELQRSRHESEAQVQKMYFEIRDQYLQAETAARLLKIYREGLVPQAASAFQAGLAAYESNRENFETILTSFLDVLRLDEEYWHSVLGHELALARLEQLTGVDFAQRTGREARHQ
jgi:outer membrane protein, heavy metal efflux system